MAKIKQLFQAGKDNASKAVLGASIGAVGLMGSAAANAAIDTEAIGASITAAENDALTTGQYVIGTVASLVVVSLIIALVKKL